MVTDMKNDPEATSPSTPLTVIFLAGAERSGSTLLGEMLGSQPGVLNIGEISLFWRDAARGNQCACGARLKECNLWGRALEHLKITCGLLDREIDELSLTRARLARTSRLRRLLQMRNNPTSWTPQEQRLVQMTAELYVTVARLTGSTILVDASKTLPALLFCGLMDLDVQIVHLVRDPRAVTASTLRSRGTVRGNAESLPPGGSLATGISRWLRSNATSVVGGLVWDMGQRRRIHYEDLLADPAQKFAALCLSLQVHFDQKTLVGHELRLPQASHACVGNPLRGAMTVPLRVDDSWETELTSRQKAVVQLATLFLQAALRRGSI